MRIEITGSGIYGGGGEIPVGTVLELKNEPIGWAGRYRVLSDAKGKTPVNNPEGGKTPAPVYEAREKAGGWFEIYDVSNKDAPKEVPGKAMREADAKQFNLLSVEDKAAFVQSRKA